MILPAPFAASGLSDRFSGIIEGLCRAVASRAAANPALSRLLVLLWSRLRRMAARFASLTERVGGRVGVRTPRRDGNRPRPSGALERLPRGFGWLVRLVPEAACYGAQLQGLLSGPGMAELLAATPGAKRVLRPLCRMLAVEPSPEVVPSARRERSRPRGDTGESAVARSPVRVGRVRVLRHAGLAWLRWRPAEEVG